MSNTPLLIQSLNKELSELPEKKDWKQIQRVVLSVVKLLDREIDVENESLFSLFTDSDGKIRANSSWFFEDSTIADRKATYKVNPNNTLNLDLKLYGLNKPSKRTISWAQALTPNFEDEPFNSKFNLGIDFIVPKTFDKVIVVLSNSYVVRTLELSGELTVTYQEIFDKWLKIQDFSNKKEVHSILWESFDLQPLNKKFYAGISERFLELRQHLINNKILDEKHSSMFSNRLIGRVIFCWFIDKKGILNPENKYFDSRSFESATKYYKERLEKLFFEILNTPIEERKYPDKITPFLNGGLFEPRTNDLYQDEKLTFPANFFDSLITFLSGYNFTTDESTSQFQQVAIDPEMLGRIFENLLAEINEDTGEQARKAKGAFYTPREIVDYMCKESLKEYLKTKLPEDEFRDQRLFQLIDAPDKDFQDQDHNWRRDWKPYKDQIIKALDELKVIDIACGSGAFPIGMMQLLLKVYERLEARFDPYKTKLQVIEQNIFGVDIEPMAVEIARLRAWLSIVVDEESDSKNIKPLPNLEFKFVCANSLISLDSGKNETQTFFDDPNLDEKLQKIRDSYFKTEDVKRKKKLREEYSALVDGASSLFGESKRSKQLKTYRPFDNENSTEFFDSEFMFGLDSFDICLGNPPYRQIQKIKDKKYQEELVKEKFETYSTTGDLYCLFYEMGMKLLNNMGIISFITSNKWMRAEYGEKLRGFLTKKDIITLLDLGPNVFETATVDTCITTLKKGEPTSKALGITLHSIKELDHSFEDYLHKNAFLMSNLSEKIWHIGPDIETQLKSKIESIGSKLSKWDIKIYRGILTGLNRAFIIDEQTRENLLSKEPKAIEIIKPILRGKDIGMYNYTFKNTYILQTGYDTDIPKLYPMVYQYLKDIGEKIEKKEIQSKGKGLFKRDDQGKNWWNLRACDYYSQFAKEKLIWQEMSKESGFCYDTKGYYCVDTARIMTGNHLLFLLGIFNSKLFNKLYSKFYAGGGLGTKGIRFKGEFMKNFPIPLRSSENAHIYEEITLIAKQISEVTPTQANLLKRIDELAYKYFTLNKNEIDYLESLD